MSVRFRFKKAGFDTLPFALYVPDAAPPKGGWPLILFLHGSGERGQDGRFQLKEGLPPALRKHPERWPAVVAAPQCPEGLRWEGETLEAAYRTLLQVEAQLQTDPRRVYLTGISMGGAGTWNLACMRPDKFAAIAPMCGAADPFKVWFSLKAMPVWNFHGVDDTVVPVEFSRVLVQALKKGGNKRHTHVELDGVGHSVWRQGYDDPDFIAWLFAQRK